MRRTHTVASQCGWLAPRAVAHQAGKDARAIPNAKHPLRFLDIKVQATCTISRSTHARSSVHDSHSQAKTKVLLQRRLQVLIHARMTGTPSSQGQTHTRTLAYAQTHTYGRTHTHSRTHLCAHPPRLQTAGTHKRARGAARAWPKAGVGCTYHKRSFP